MKVSAHKAVAIVGVGAVLPGAPNAPKFWQNIKDGVYSITEVQPDRWDPALYYDADPKAPDKTYSKIGGWAREWEWDPLKWKMPIPPRVSQAMDLTQKWAIVAVREALADYGYPNRPLDAERTAVILGNAMAGDTHLYSAARVLFADYAEQLAHTPGFVALPAGARKAILEELRAGIGKRLPEITEDTMPGELANIIAGRVAALWDFKGPNFVADAACASAMAALSAAVGGLVEGDYDAVLSGGIDANMSPSTFVKFCKIGALSPTGSRPYAAGADGFIMGEGAVTFLLKRLSDAERDGDRIYAVIRGMGGSSDGKGKGITAPNPVGQKICVRRAWHNAGVVPAAGGLMEGHGTSTVVGDVVEVQSLSEVFAEFGLPPGSVALGSVKSNIGHLKGGAGSAGILKAMFALHEKVLPPSVNFHKPNPEIDFSRSPFYVITQLKPWEVGKGAVRQAGVSAFGFGGTNFHTVLEEYIPGRIAAEAKLQISVPAAEYRAGKIETKTPMRGAMVIGAGSEAEIMERVKAVLKEAEAGRAPAPATPAESDLQSQVRLAIDYGDAAELADKCGKALKALEENQTGRWKALRAKGIFLGHGPAPKVAFLFAGQGSQYVNMLRSMRESEPIVAETFAAADRVMQPLLGKKLSECIFLDEADEKALALAEQDLKQTAITQPAVLTTETALLRVLGAYGITPDMVMGHSLGEYGALVASGAMSFEEALRAVSARGNEMTRCALDDNGVMAAVFGPIAEIEKILATIEGYVVIANINSSKEAVIGGETASVEKAMEAVRAAGYRAQQLQVSHAFHTKIVAPASESLAQVLSSMKLQSPTIPIISNATGNFYPMGPGVVPEMIDLLGKQVASPVQFVKGLNTLYDAGARVFVEVGPKRVLYGFVEDVLGDREGVVSLFTNHPRIGEAASLNLALCGLYAAGLGIGKATVAVPQPAVIEAKPDTRIPAANREVAPAPSRPTLPPPVAFPAPLSMPATVLADADRYVHLGHLFADFLEKSFQVYSGSRPAQAPARICITGASLGLPGVERVFDDSNIERILRGDQFIHLVPMEKRRAMLEKNITRLVKTEAGEGRFETIESLDDVIKLAARAKELNLVRDFGFPEDRLAALDHVTRLAIAAGIDALRDAGIPLVMRYKTTTKGTMLPDRWGLPDDMRDDTGVLFTSAFPGYDSFEEIISGFYRDKIRHERLEELKNLRAKAFKFGGNGLVEELDRRIAELKAEIDSNPYRFDRRFLFRVLSMGHSQFAEYIGARGPNTSTNGACASGTQAVAIASDWIQAGRCRRVIIISADDVVSDNLIGWFGSGFLASGAAATDEIVEEAATPFDRRRHGLIIGMGASAMVVESLDSARDRGLTPICEVLGSVAANSAYHGTRLDVSHICQVMEKLISEAESRWGINRFEIAPQTVFVSHETYTPARGGSASAEVFALRYVFKDAADKIVVANTKGATGHPMAVGIEDVVGVKILETGIVPPVPNFKEVDPELGMLNLSKGGHYPVQYALRLGAGFGSQICMTLSRWTPTPDGQRRSPDALGFTYRINDANAWRAWLKRISGYEAPEMEVLQRTLRIKDQGPAALATSAPAQIQATEVVAAPVPVAVVQLPVVAPAQPADAAAAPAQAQTGPAVSVDPVQVEVMRIISDKTGYPTDMLDLELDLEADLGIDTVKQAEMFAAIRAAYDIPRDESLKLRDFPTLAHAVKFVYDRRPDLKAPLKAAATAAPAAPAAPASVPQAVAAAPVQDAVKERVMAIIAEKTGYPPDMLDPELDLEADLGIDTVKQAEMFAAIRAEYDIPRDDALKLRDFPTLRHTIQFVYDRRPDLKAPVIAAVPAAPATPAVAAGPAAQSAPSADLAEEPVKIKVLQIIAEKTGYPSDMLDLDLDLEADLGIDTVKQAEMFAAIRAEYDIPRDDTLKLRDFPTLKHTIQFVYDRRPDLKPAVTPAPVVAPAPVAVAPAAVAAALVAATPSAGDTVKDKVLQIIAAKTGYPPDMLDLDLDLEADLGIDTVKQAEMFAAIRAEYDIPRDDALKLRDFPTLKHTIQFVFDRRPDLAQKPEGAPAPPAPPAAGPAVEETGSQTIVGSMEAAAALPRRVPFPRLRPALGLCKATGVQLTSKSRVIVMCDQGGVGKALAGKLEKLGVQVLAITDAPDADTLTGRIEEWKAQGPIQGVYWLAALDQEAEIGAMDLASWREATRVRVKLLYTAMRALYDHVGERGTFLVSATRLGGLHGYDEAGALAPLGGCVTGFTKAFKREKGDALVKAIDFEPSRKTSALSEVLIEETLSDPGAVEIGYRQGQRWTIGLEEKPLSPDAAGLTLGKGTVFLVTGAAGSIVSAITADLAAASGGTFHLLDLAPAPDPSNADLKRFATDKEGLKRDIFERMKARGERATPALVEKEMAALERSYTALAALEAVKKAGGAAHYYCVNLLDASAVAAVMKKVASTSGRIDVMLHAAGLEVSRLLPDKKPSEFELVFDVKSDGWFNLLSNLGDMPLGAAVVFSSIAGRFGNGGQTDYSSANDLLCKSISNFRSTRPKTCGIALDWTAWSGIGMAARGSIPTVMKQAGIDMLAPEAGIPFVRRELIAGGRGEVVVAQNLGIMLKEFDESGGLDVAKTGAVDAVPGVMTGKVVGMGLYSGLRVETMLDPARQPFLYDHQINGTPVLPGVMGIEALAEAARLLYPERHIGAIENVDFHSPFKFYRSQPRTVTLRADFTAEGDDIVADCQLIGSRVLHGQSEPEVTTHFEARVRLVTNPSRPAKQKAVVKPGNGNMVQASDIYRLYFHGPAYQVVESSWRAGKEVVGLYASNLPANHEPDSLSTLVSPRLIELCFQTAGMWELATKARMGLPHRVDRLSIHKAPDAEQARLHSVVTPNEDGGFDARVVDQKGNIWLALSGYRTMALPEPVDDALLEPLRKAMR